MDELRSQLRSLTGGTAASSSSSTPGTSGSKRKRPQPFVLASAGGTTYEDKSNDFLCPICFEIIQEAHVTKCGHTFCFHCISSSLERNKRCPKCNYTVDCIFPNFLLNELISKYNRTLLQKKLDANRQKGLKHEVSEIQEILSKKSQDLSLQDVNTLIESLNRKKQCLEQTSLFLKAELLREFLSQAKKHKQEQLDQISRELSLIEDDIKRADDLLSNPRENHIGNKSPGEATANISIIGLHDPNTSSSRVDSSCTPTGDMLDPAAVEPSSSNQVTDAFNHQLTLDDTTFDCLNRRKNKMLVHFDVLESCYFNTRAKSLILSSSEDDTNDGLEDFTRSLNQFTSYSGLRPLAHLCYTSDLFSGSSIVSSIEFDKDNEFFAIAGVTKKIKLFEYASVVRDSLDMHYPVIEMECNSKISCVSWSSYMKHIMASSDYEGSVTVWDAFSNQKLRVFQEHEKRCWSVDFNRVDTKLIASGSDDAKVKLWATNMERSVACLEAKANVCCVKFNPSKRYYLAFGSADHCVHYYDLRNTKTPLNIFKGHEKAVSYVKFINENELVSASTDSQLKLWSLTDNHCLRSLRGHQNEKNFVGLATSGDFIACGSENNSLYVYFKGVPRHSLSFHFDSGKHEKDRRDDTDSSSDFVSAVCWRAGTNVIAAANSQGIIKILELI